MVIKASGLNEICGYLKTYSENNLAFFVTKLFNGFCGAHQGSEETVAGRGCRLEGLLDSATRQPPTLLWLIGSIPA